MSSKKRKVDSECRIFQDEWTWKYFFTVFRDKPLCLICNENIAVYKDYNISRHFNSKHNDVKVRAMTEEERKQKADLRNYQASKVFLRKEIVLSKQLHMQVML